MKQYQTFELEFIGKEPCKSFVKIDLTAEFRCKGQVKRVKGFYAGGGRYIIRFLPQHVGLYTWKVIGIFHDSGQEVCEKSDTDHGIVRAVKSHFEYEDGMRFIPFGTTVYALLHQTEELIECTMDTLRKAPFNKIRYCVFPKSYDFNHNEPMFFPFEKDESGKWNVNRPCFKFWDHFEQVLDQLSEMGIQSDLILFHPYDRWGFAELSLEDNETYLDYLLRRLSAKSAIWWSLANEYDLVCFKTMNEWYNLEEIVAAGDPYDHLLSNHNCFMFYDFNRSNITHCSMQTTQLYKAAKWIEEYKKPVVYDECCYEGDLELEWGNISAKEMVSRFWRAYSVGAYATHGETFMSEDEILWWSKGGKLKGKSPDRIAFLRTIIEEIQGTIVPWHPIPYIGAIAEKENYMENPIFKQVSMWMSTLPAEELEKGEEKVTKYTGQAEHAYIRYFHIECNSQYHLKLPEDRTYRIEVIDTWEMTRTVFKERARGNVLVKLPGKEGIAVLATEVR